jgi:ubiquinone/menaquinone biosynthesis C-methylase UbiE
VIGIAGLIRLRGEAGLLRHLHSTFSIHFVFSEHSYGITVMHSRMLFATALIALAISVNLSLQGQSTPDSSVIYTEGPRTRDGIGKYYMGREIAQVMGHQGISWLERDNREDEEAPSKAIALLDLKPNTDIADIGAGSGYYSFRIAKKYPSSKAIAVDIQQEMLNYITSKAAAEKITNVVPHLGSIKSIQMPPETIDAALFVDAYHEFSHPHEMMTSIFNALRPGGIVYLLEYRAEDPKVPIKPLHKMTQAQAKKEMNLVGFNWVETKNDLPWQHFMIFEKPR